MENSVRTVLQQNLKLNNLVLRLMKFYLSINALEATIPYMQSKNANNQRSVPANKSGVSTDKHTNLYAFQLGRKHRLCLCELLMVLGKENLIENNKDCAIFKIPNLKDPQALQDRLGGTIKIIKLVAKFDNLDSPKKKEEKIKESIAEIMESFFEDAKGKIPFGLSIFNQTTFGIKDLLNFGKKTLKELGLNCRFVNNPPTKNPKPSTIYKAKIISKGIDLNLIHGEEHTYLGHSVALQNIDNYSLRDYEKPCRDAKVGMMPPKLAQIMINLAGKDVSTIYDPFCGSGTTLLEGMLMPHIKAVIGSDLDARMCDFSNQNCKWLKEKFKTYGDFNVFERDARFLNSEVLKQHGISSENIDAIVTEGFLGLPQSRVPEAEKRDQIFRTLANLHLNWLTAVHKITRKNCKVIMCVAAFRINSGSGSNKIEYLPRLKELVAAAGYHITDGFLYDREDQIVAREVVVLEKI